MKKILLVSIAFLSVITCIVSAAQEDYTRWSTALTSGYVFKHNARFKQVYGQGIVNILTGDGYYYFCEHWGLGAIIGYWRAQGATNFLQQPTLLQQVPATIAGKGKYEFDCGVQLYGALGAGFIWTKENSYLDNTGFFKGIGTLEAGITYSVYHCFEITGAFRYLFPPQKQAYHTVDIGGCDLRAGIEFSF